MESRRLTPLLITLFAALAFLYPKTRRPAPGTIPHPPTNTPEPQAESPEGGLPVRFPHREGSRRPVSLPAAGNQPRHRAIGRTGYAIEFLIATVPDPVSSRLPHFFDSFVESLESAAEASGYTLDRFALPWLEKGKGPVTTSPVASNPLRFCPRPDSFPRSARPEAPAHLSGGRNSHHRNSQAGHVFRARANGAVLSLGS